MSVVLAGQVKCTTCSEMTANITKHTNKHHQPYFKASYPHVAKETMHQRICGPSYHTKESKTNLILCRNYDPKSTCNKPLSISSLHTHTKTCGLVPPAINPLDLQKIPNLLKDEPIEAQAVANAVAASALLPKPSCEHPLPTSDDTVIADQVDDAAPLFNDQIDTTPETNPTSTLKPFRRPGDIFQDPILEAAHLRINTHYQVLICVDCCASIPAAEVASHVYSHHRNNYLSPAARNAAVSHDFVELYRARIAVRHLHTRENIKPRCRNCIPVAGLVISEGFSCAADLECTYAAPLPDSVRKHHREAHKVFELAPHPAPRIQTFYQETYQWWFPVSDEEDLNSNNIALLRYYQETTERQANLHTSDPLIRERHAFYMQPDYRFHEYLRKNYKQSWDKIRNIAHGQDDSPAMKDTMRRLREVCFKQLREFDGKAVMTSHVLRQYIRSRQP
jgi:hypothetical protein